MLDLIQQKYQREMLHLGILKNIHVGRPNHQQNIQAKILSPHSAKYFHFSNGVIN